MADERPTFGSLFAGIGGIDLGLERAGWECRWQVEWDQWCQHNLGHHWPAVPRHGDITRVDWTAVEPVDLIAGGFPCQPVSAAGRRRGQSDERWLWPAFASAVRALRPRYVLVENVPGLLRPWLDRDGCGLWHEAPIEDVVADLATLGYRWEYDCIPASAVGAPHERDRVWIVAHTASYRRGSGRAGRLDPSGSGQSELALSTLADAGRLGVQSDRRPREASRASGPAPGEAPERQWGWDTAGDGGSSVAHPERGRQPGSGEPVDAGDPAASSAWQAAWPLDGGLLREWGAQSLLGGGADGLPGWLDGHRWPARPGEPQYEWEPPRVAPGVPDRTPRLKALGNAVVPQIPELIGRRLLEVIESESAA